VVESNPDATEVEFEHKLSRARGVGPKRRPDGAKIVCFSQVVWSSLEFYNIVFCCLSRATFIH
jgi:hypothetical protein